MESRLRVQGQPIQPMLVTFPFGLFACASIFDLADASGGPAFLGEVGYWTAVAALVAAALAGIAGMIDLWDSHPGGTRRTAVTFNLVNLAMAAIFVMVCLIRADAPEQGATGGMVIVELLALAVGGVGVWLGARLVRQFDGRRTEPTSLDALSRLPSARRDAVRRRTA